MIPSRKIFSRLSFLCVFLFLYIQPCPASQQRETVILQPGKTVYPLQHPLIVVDSLSGAGDLSVLFDELYGRLIILQPPDEHDTLLVHYRYSDADVPQKMDLGIGKISGWFPEERDAKDAGPGKDLSNVSTTGSVSRKLEVGSTGQSMLSGGLDLRISGELSPGIRIKGVISDNDAPFEDYASTQSVQDVDNVLINIYSDQFDAQIGDVFVNSEWNHWNRFHRKLIGARFSYRGDRYTGAAFAGSARGRFQRQEIPAREGDQGPYRLLADNGDNAIMIVPESEQIYVDGVPLDRSLYTIYYRDAELFFSSGIMISERSRIVAEFNYVNEFYARASLGAASSWRFGKHIRLQASFVREKDDENNPVDVHLSNIPADSLAAIVSGDGHFTISTAIADSAGDYESVDGIWSYAGEGKGTHTVYFYRENRNGGYIRSYDAEGKTVYRYAPEDPLSQYFPRRKITLPSTQWIGAMQLELGQEEKAHAVIEGAYSGFDPNNYNTESGTITPAFKWDAELPLGKVFRVRTDGWMKDPLFSTFSRLTRPDYERYLGFSASDTITQTASFTAETAHELLRSTTSLEYVSDVRKQKRTRLLAKGTGNIKGMEFRYDGSRLIAQGSLPYYSFSTSAKVPAGEALVFSASWLQDHFGPVFTGVTPYRTESAGAGLSWNKWELQYTYRKDYDWAEADSAFSAYSRKHDLALRFDQSFFKERINWEATASYRFDQRETVKNHYLLSGSRMGFQFKKIGLSGNLKTNINRTSETRNEAVFIFVGDGLGNYRLDDYGQYVPDDMGNFIMRNELTNERQDQYVSKFGSTLNWKKDLKKVRVQFSHSGSSDLRTPDLNLYASVDINDPDTSVFYNNMRFKHELRVGSTDGKRLLSLLLEDIRSQNFQTAYNENIHTRSARWVKYRVRPGDLTLDFYYKYGSRQQHRMPLNSYRVRTSSHGFGSEAEYLFSGKFRISAKGKYERIKTDFRETFIAHWISAGTQWIWYRVAGERLFFSGGLDRVVSDYAGSLPYETANGLPAGWSWTGAVRYEKSINQFLSAGTFVQFRKRAEQKSIITANLEVKAYF